MNTLSAIILAGISFFTPLTFGGVQPWAQLLLLCASLVLAMLMIFGNGKIRLTAASKPVLIIMAFLIFMAAVQSCNVKTIFSAPFWQPFTLSPLDTISFAGYVLMLTFIFISSSQVFYKYSRVNKLCFAIMLSGLLTALIGFSSVKGEYINTAAGTGFMRETFGPFINRNHAAVFLDLCFFASLAWNGPATVIRKDFFNLPKKPIFWKMPGYIFSTILAVGIIYTRSRGGILAFCVGLLCYFALVSALTLKSARSRILSLTLIGAILLSLPFIADSNIKAINKFARRDGENWGFSVETRENLYTAGYYMLMDYKTFGVGLNAFENGIFPYLDKPVKAYIEHLHNDWLELLTGSGFFGGAVLLIGIIWFIIAILRGSGGLPKDKILTLAALISGCVSMATASFFDFHFFIPSNAILFFTLAGLICAPTFSCGKIRDYRVGYISAAAVLILFIPFIFLNFNKTVAWRYENIARYRLGEEKINYFDRALAKYPHPREALRAAIAQYNYSNDDSLPCEERNDLRKQSFALSSDYLAKYPLYDELENVKDKSSKTIFCKI